MFIGVSEDGLHGENIVRIIVRGQISHLCGGIVALANYDRAKSIDFEALCEYFTVIVRGRVSHSYSGVVTLALSGS